MATRSESGAGPTTTSGVRSRSHATPRGNATVNVRSEATSRKRMAVEIPRATRRRNQDRSDRPEVRRGIQEVVAGVIEDPVERAIGFDAEHLVDAAEREVVAAAGLVTSRVDEPWLHADALYECRWLPGGRHGLPRRERSAGGRRRRIVQEARHDRRRCVLLSAPLRSRATSSLAAAQRHAHAAEEASSPKSGSLSGS